MQILLEGVLFPVARRTAAHADLPHNATQARRSAGTTILE